MNYNIILENNGGNLYKMPHMGKSALEKTGKLPLTIVEWTKPEDIMVEDSFNDDNNDNNNIDLSVDWLGLREGDDNDIELADCFFSGLEDNDAVVDDVWFIGDYSGEAENEIDEYNRESEEIQYL
jgi:hypothetical protein